VKPVRVVHVVEALGRGGLERVVASLAGGASDRFEVTVLALAGGGPLAEEMRAARIDVRCLGLGDYYPRSVVRAARALVDARAALVHTHGHFAGVAGRLAARLVGIDAVVHHLHTTDTTLRPRHRRLERLLGMLSRRILCCSGAVARHARIDLLLPDSLLQLVPNGIEPAPPADQEAARQALGSPAPPIAGCVGSLTPHKGQATLLRAWATRAAGPGTLVLVGDGPERSALVALAARLGLAGRVVFAGARPDARRLLPAFDLLILPSRVREGLSLAALEGMDAGLPLVATRVGGLPEIVEDGRTGILVPEDDHEAMAAAIDAVLGDPDRARAWGAAGRRRVEESFRAAVMVRRVESIYEVALAAVSRAA
jgi:glycosyltransferase involved in cell wall biosynthesis